MRTQDLIDELAPSADAVAIQVTGPEDEYDARGDLRLVWKVTPIDECGCEAGETITFPSYKAALRAARAAARVLALDVDDASWPMDDGA